jgi:hypothetical protein
VAGSVPDTNIKFAVESAEEDQQFHGMDITATEVTSTPLESIADVKGNITVSTLPFPPLMQLYSKHRFHGCYNIFCMQFDLHIFVKFTIGESI